MVNSTDEEHEIVPPPQQVVSAAASVPTPTPTTNSSISSITSTPTTVGLTSRLFKSESTMSNKSGSTGNNINTSNINTSNTTKNKTNLRTARMGDEDDEMEEDYDSQMDTNEKMRKKNKKAKKEKKRKDKETNVVRYLVQKVTSLVGPTLQKLPKSYRYTLLILWLIWKVVMTIVFINVVLKSWCSTTTTTTTTTDTNTSSRKRRNQKVALLGPSSPSDETTKLFRILHIVTALQEYDTKSSPDGETKADRLANILLPVLSTVVQSLLHTDSQQHWSVDVYLILGYELQPHRLQLIRQSLPSGVGLQVWDDAIPLGYDEGRPKKIHLLTPITRTLARQHRFVLKDKLDQYDFFTVFEDDMLFTADHVQYFLDVSEELNRLTMEAKKASSTSSSNIATQTTTFYGNLSWKQTRRLIPGFFRVEVLPTPPPQQQFILDTSIVPIDPTQPLLTANPYYCCYPNILQHPPNNHTLLLQQRLPKNPLSNQLIVWETAIQGFSLREFPTSSYLDWVAFLPGVRRLPPGEDPIQSYWSGTQNDKQNTNRPFIGNPQFFAQQGGFMLSQKQIKLLEEDLCQGRFLPPFVEPYILQDGLWENNVEFYSGGFQLFGNDEMDAGCNLQRIVDLNPTNFSKHLIYHTTNNKQRSIPQKRIVPLDYLFTQLHTAKLHAVAAKAHEQQQQQQQQQPKR